MGEDDGGSGAGEGDAEQEALRQREEVARLREAAYWKAVVDVIREETWQVNFSCAVMFNIAVSLMTYHYIHSRMQHEIKFDITLLVRSTGGMNFT